MRVTWMRLADARAARAQAADAADDQVIVHAGLRGRVERLDDVGVDQRVHLGDDPRRPPGPGVLRLALDERRGPRSCSPSGATTSLFHSGPCA